MRLEDLSGYVAERSNLTKFEVKAEDDTCGHMVVIETKETYVYEDEQEADDKINEARQDALFLGATKKYKQGKISKTGDILRNETWTVVVKLGH